MVKISSVMGFFVVLILRIMTWIGVKCFNVDMQTKDPT